MFILIQKGNKRKRISKLAWENNPNKMGWSEVSETSQVVSNETKSKIAPVVNVGNVKNEKTNQIVVEEVVEETTETKTSIVVDPAKEEELKAEAKQKFIDFATNAKIKAGHIKDYLDSKDVKYKQNSATTILIELLADQLNNNIDELKNNFGL